MMRFSSVRLITDDVDRLVEFYEFVTGMRCERPSPAFAELVTTGGTLAIGSSATLPLFEGCGLSAADNTSAIVEFQVDDVDQDRARLGDRVEILQEPTTMPLGQSRSDVGGPGRQSRQPVHTRQR